jgi:hypothetical protein
MLNARTYFARMNNNRTHDSWLTEQHLLKGAEEFFGLNEYSNIEYDKEFDKGSRSFSSAISAYKKAEETDNDEFDQILVGVVRPKINNYDLQFFGYLESILYDVMDNYEYTKLMLL